QAALLEAMQEHQVTTGGVRHMLPEPFFVLATRNPIEQEGTYPLPEAQLDRFMFEVLVDYPSEAEEFAIVRQTTAEAGAAIETVLSRDDLVRLQAMVRRVPVADHVIRYAMQFSRLTRQPLGRRRNAPGHQVPVPDFIREYVSWGAGPRASQYLILGARARAVLQGRTSAGIQDVKAVAGPVLRHRIITSFNAESEGITADDIIHRLAEMIPADPGELAGKDGFPDVFRAADAH
ncbi:MAG: MoxR family ATPase, partial [Planctomycetaceae bacterium]|nr:MoxR family ATPase [Planctomycetaceae bacterium]